MPWPCSRNVVLVGDAGHSVYPALGQGANAALEGAATLAAVLQGKRSRQGAPRCPGSHARCTSPSCLPAASAVVGPKGALSRTHLPTLTYAHSSPLFAEVGAQDVEAVAAEYSRRWLPNALAVAELTEEGFGKNARAFAPNLKLVQLICQMLLHKLLPFLVPMPAFFQASKALGAAGKRAF